MDLTAAIAEVKARGADYLTDARITTMLNDAKAEFEDYWWWPWLETTATDTAPITLTDIRHILYVLDGTQNIPLLGTTANDIVMQQSWNDVGLTSGSSENPAYWYLDGTDTVSVFPSNSVNTLYVRYVKVSPELSSGTDTPLIPVQYHNLWIDLTMARVYQDSDDFARAGSIRAFAMQRLAQIQVEYETRNLQNTTTQQLYNGADW